MLIPISGEKFETKNWQLAALVSKKYNVKPTLLYIGSDESKLEAPKAIFSELGINYEVVVRNSKKIGKTIVDVFHEGDYQLISLASRRRKGFFSRLFGNSVSKYVVDEVSATVLQVHPPKYGHRHKEIDDIFVLLDGSLRDPFLGRWARLIESSGPKSKLWAYHVVSIPQTISLEDAAQFKEVKQSQHNFEQYSRAMFQRLGLDADPVLLYGHNFVKSLVQATKNHEPDAVLIGHTKDTGIWNRVRTRLAYRIMRNVDSAVIVHHMSENNLD